MSDDRPLRINIKPGKELRLPPRTAELPPRPAPPPPTGEPSRLSAEVRDRRVAEEVAKRQASPDGVPTARKPTSELLAWCREHLQRATTPKTAQELVKLWCAAWRGQSPSEKPPKAAKKHQPGNIDRVSKWLERHERAGRLRVVDHKGRWNARRYLQIEGADWRRKRRSTKP